MSKEEAAAFTRKLTDFWSQTRFFRWLSLTTHGLDRSAGHRDFSAFWTGETASRQGLRLLVRHRPDQNPDNIMIPTADLLAQFAAGALLTGSPELLELTRSFANGISSTLLGMVWNEADPVLSIMARAVMPETHDIRFPDGRVKTVDFSDWRRPTEAWNTATIHIPDNPYYGDVWVKNTRSKDDLPHLFRAAFYLPYVAACGPAEEVRATAAEASALLQGFARDVLEQGYRIRTKDASGAVFFPQGDLASLVAYDGLLPDAECNAKLSVALLGTADPQGLDCGNGRSSAYELLAVIGHYYNLAIIRGFHLSALLFALGAGLADPAKVLLEGLTERVEADRTLPDSQLPVDRGSWERDLAVFLVQSAAAGLPLTGDEVRLVHRRYEEAFESLRSFPAWDPWDPGLPDGDIPWRPEGPTIQPQDLSIFFEHCFSPYRNPTSQPLVDCDLLRVSAS